MTKWKIFESDSSILASMARTAIISNGFDQKKKKETKDLKRDETSKLMGSDDRLPTLFGSFRPEFLPSR